MPRQNRVTPFGELIATECRGTLMGNRGCLHDERQRIRRPFACKRWILCVLQFRGRRRTVMAPGRYTELFFLDEVTGLAAGHRPCAECQRQRYHLFRDTWTAANPDQVTSVPPSADEMDDVLHAERLTEGRSKRTYTEQLSRLPAGVIVDLGERSPHLVLEKTLVPWRPGGYGPAIARPKRLQVAVLTPPSIVRVLERGYPVAIHPSALR